MVTLLQQKYSTDHPERAKELLFCRRTNINRPEIDIYLPHLGTKARLKFSHAFDSGNNFPDGILIVANSDIYFDETLKNIHNIKEDEFYCISRIDVTSEGNKPFHEEYSQDVWAVRWPMKYKIQNIDFHLGILGCDNVLAREAQRAGYKLKNPCKSINCYHLHQSEFRTYRASDRLPKPYTFVTPE